MVDLVEILQEQWDKNAELVQQNQRLLLMLHDAEEQLITLQEILGLNDE